MDAELKAKWVAALRSGEYPKCMGRLHDGIGYCCLGVLAKIQKGAVGECGQLLYPENNLLPDLIQDALIRMNDGDVERGIPSKTFPEIADYIEQTL